MAKSTVAVRISHGTSILKVSGDSSVSSSEPASPPITLGAANHDNQRREARNSRRYPQAAAKAPGIRATVFVQLANRAASPEVPRMAYSVGNVSSVPPPAMAFIAPATAAARHNKMMSNDMRIFPGVQGGTRRRETL